MHSNRVALSCSKLGKRYTLGEKNDVFTFVDFFANQFKGWLGRKEPRAQMKEREFWALKDLSFELETGKVLGIVGKNGSGKSTLLKILSRITPPTCGEFSYNGTMASLLEVGTGFKQELTGLDNIFLSGTTLGLKRADIQKKLDEIIAFAEIEKFIDTPVKKYSSGMYVRLAFAVAAHLEPDILLLDEVLAVGDQKFQKKCLQKMNRVADEGRTVLFVSHNMQTVTQLCHKAILLDAGQFIMEGSVEEVVKVYQERNQRDIQRSGKFEFDKLEDHSCQVMQIRIGPESSPKLQFDIMEAVEFEVLIDVQQDFEDLQLMLIVSTLDGMYVLSSRELDWGNYSNQLNRQSAPKGKGKYRIAGKLPAPLLNTGFYELTFSLWADIGRLMQNCNAIQIEVHDHHSSFSSCVTHHPASGIVSIPVEWETETLS